MNMCPTNKCKTAPETCLKGQVFFILTNCSNLETLKSRISLLGGKVDEFLSKDVTTLLVEDNQLVGLEVLPPDLTVKPTYNTVNGTIIASYPYPGSYSNIPSTSSGYNSIAANTSSKYSPYRLICYARQYGIQVVGIAQFLTWTEPQIKVIRQKQPRKSPKNVSNLSGYFIKFESVNKNYRPCYKMFNNDPDRLVPLKNANVLVKPETCNVILSKPVQPKQQFNHMDAAVRPTHLGKGAKLPVKANEKKPQNNRLRPKEDNNYCECCKTHFADFKQHIKSSKHQSFVSNDKNYESVHNILKMLPTPQEFIENLQKPSPNSDSALTNGDASLCLSVTNIPEVDYSVPLNLEVKRENIAGAVMPLNMHVDKNEHDHNLQIKDEVMPLPLDLHVKRDHGIKTEIKQETNLFANFGQTELHTKEETNIMQPKVEADKDAFEYIKADEKHPIGLHDDIQCDDNGGDFFDRTNTAALAQLCLKNFDSYWLDNLPCDMEDMEFDDNIFDFDEGKTKIDNEGFVPFVDDNVNSEVAQMPDLISGISTSNLKTQNTENTSMFLNTSVDVKDYIKTEPPDLDIISSTCKLEKDNEASILTQNIAASFNESVLEDKKSIFSIAAFCSDKVSLEATPSCSNTVPSKNPELLFSSESSDDENGNVLISNALHFITNSDNEIKVDKESSEENSISEKFEEKPLPKQKNAVKKFKNDQIKQTSTVKDGLDSNEVHGADKDSSSSMPNNPVRETNMSIKSFHENKISVDKIKLDLQSNKDIPSADNIVSNFKNQNVSAKENFSFGNVKSSNNIKLDHEKSLGLPVEVISSGTRNIGLEKSVSSSPVDNELPHSVKTDLESRKENTLLDKEKEWDYTCNKIYKKYQVPLNRTLDKEKILKERISFSESEGEIPASVQNKRPEEIKVVKTTSERYPNPKKNISMREMMINKSSSDVSSVTANVSCEKANYQNTATIKNLHSQDENSLKSERRNESNIKLNTSNTSFASLNTVPSERRNNQTTCESVLSVKNLVSQDGKFSSKDKRILETKQNFNFPEVSHVLTKPVSSLSHTNYTVENLMKDTYIPHRQKSLHTAKDIMNTFDNKVVSTNLIIPKGKVNQDIKEVISSIENSCSGEVKSCKIKDPELIANQNYSNISTESSKPITFEKKVNQKTFEVISSVKDFHLQEEKSKNLKENSSKKVKHGASDKSISSASPSLKRTNEANYEVKTSVKNPQEGKTHVKRKHSETKASLGSSDASISSMKEKSGKNTLKHASNRVLSFEENLQSPKEKIHKKNQNAEIKSSFKSSETRNVQRNPISCQKEINQDKCELSSAGNLHSLEGNISKKERQSDEKVSTKASNSDVAPLKQIPSETTLSQTPYDAITVNVQEGNISNRGEYNSEAKDNLNISAMSISSVDQVPCGMTIKSPCGIAHIKNPQPQEKISNEGNPCPVEMDNLNTSNAKNYPVRQISCKNTQNQALNAVACVTNVHSQAKHISSKHNTETKNIHNVSVNQISCEATLNVAPSSIKNTQLLEEESNKKRKLTPQINSNITKTNTALTDSIPSDNRMNQISTYAENLKTKQKIIHKNRVENVEFTLHPSTSNASKLSTNVVSSEKKAHHINYEHFVPVKRKRSHTKERKPHKKVKHNSLLIRKCSFNETSVIKEQSFKSSSNPCQYSYRTAKYNVDNSSNTLSVKSSGKKQSSKIPHTKKSSKLRELGPLWTVSVNGVKLKFTRIYPKKVDTYQYVTEDDSD